MLYKFNKLAAKLDELGFDSVAATGMRIMKRDLTQEANAGNIKFKSDGVYLTIDGREYKGYMYHKHPNIGRFGMPKFHITECTTVHDQKARGQFDNNYYWQNSSVVDLIDRGTRVEHNGVQLLLCNNCRQQSQVNYRNTQGFFETLDELMEDQNTEFEVDMSGYPLRPINWYEVSKKYREDKNYTCEGNSCGITISNPVDRRFIHVHHKDGNKLNCRLSNLQSLCVLCHSRQDERHIQNFQANSLRIELKTFLQSYKEELKALGNKYI